MFSSEYNAGTLLGLISPPGFEICDFEHCCFQEEPEYEEPPALPPRLDDFEEPGAPPLPERSIDVDDDDGEYEDIGHPPPPPPQRKGLPLSKAVS